MRAALAALSALGLPLVGFAQVPNVLVRVDATLSIRILPNAGAKLRAWDLFGRRSTVGFAVALEPGFDAYISQRLGEIHGEADDEQLEEYYVEDAGYWRVGKQFLPFGRQHLMRETVPAGRIDTSAGGEAVPLSLAACKGDNDLQQGVVGRLGGRIGISFAVGEHFGIGSSSLTVIRRPEDAPGEGSGYRRVLGLDYESKIGRWTIAFEAASFRGGARSTDRDLEVSELSASSAISKDASVTLGWSRDWNRPTNVLRAQAAVAAAPNVWIEPYLRWKDSSFFDGGISVRVRL